MSQCNWEKWEAGGQAREVVQAGMGWGGQESINIATRRLVLPPVSCPTDKRLMLWGRGRASAAKQEGRKREYGKNSGVSKREMGKEGMS